MDLTPMNIQDNTDDKVTVVLDSGHHVTVYTHGSVVVHTPDEVASHAAGQLVWERPRDTVPVTIHVNVDALHSPGWESAILREIRRAVSAKRPPATDNSQSNSRPPSIPDKTGKTT